jgi:uncharacterized protein
MSLKILIDGYNFLWQSAMFRTPAIANLKEGREAMLSWITEVGAVREPPLQEKFDISIIFDAHKSPQLESSSEEIGGIQIVYTSQGQTADDYIKDLCSEFRDTAIVISSDREVQRNAEKKGCGVLGSREFQIVLERPEELTTDPTRKFKKSKRKALSRLGFS